MSQDVEPSLSEYARFYGLTRDHLDNDPLAALAVTHDVSENLEDDPTLFSINETKDIDLNEKICCGKDEALLLGSVAENTGQAWEIEERSQLNHRRIREMKVETPLLRTDHEYDMQAFHCSMVPDLANEHLPLESLDEEADEGLTWPHACQELPDQYMRTAEKECLEISIDELNCLQASLCLDSKPVVHLSFEGNELEYTRHTTEDTIEVPLMPMSPKVVPYEPSSDTGRLEMVPEPSSPTRQELDLVDQKVFKENTVQKRDKVVAIAREAYGMLSEAEHLGQIYSPLQGIDEPPSSPPLGKPSTREAKVEVPLTPQSDRLPPWERKHVSFSEVLHEVIPELPSPFPKLGDMSSEDIDKLVAENIAPIAMRAERSIEQEQLQEADTTHRVIVPVMDFSRPRAPWEFCEPASMPAAIQSREKSLSETLKVHFQKHSGPNGGANELSLKWMPFPAALGRVETYESIPDTGITSQFLDQPECVDTDTLIWKPEGLRIFDDLMDSDEERLENGTFPDDRDIVSLLRKRKLQLERGDESDSGSADDNTGGQQGKPVNHDAFRKIPRLEPPWTKANSDDNAAHAGGVSASFSAVDSLDNFMSLRSKGPTNSKRAAHQHIPKSQIKAQPQTTTNGLDAIPTEIQQAPSYPQALDLSIPEFTVPDQSMPFVVSTSFLMNRTLARRIQQLYPTADLIERDFGLHLTPHRKQPSKPDGGVLSSSDIANEADMILSPSTGLIVTTLQKIKQRALPGQAASSTIRERIRRTTPRYERLLVIVSHGASTSFTSPVGQAAFDHLDPRDCEAFFDFNAFCSAIHDECRAILLGGTEETLAQWVVALMVKYGLNDTNVKLLQDETLWEVFLRRAGMNAFAAQAILSDLKPPDKDSTGFSSPMDIDPRFGLSAFVRMSKEEKLARFKLLMGGSRVLGSISDTLDARW